MSGILLDRLSHGQQRRWRTVEKLVTAYRPDGAPRYPTLSSLWRSAASGGHSIYIELVAPGRVPTGIVGDFRIERLDAEAKHYVAAIRLCLDNIDAAHVGKDVERGDGFVPLAGLGRQKRYAEVLAHELAHADFILADPSRARMLMEPVRTATEELLSYRAKNGSLPFEPTLERRLSERDALLRDLEAQAERVEKTVWLELLPSGPERWTSQ